MSHNKWDQIDLKMPFRSVEGTQQILSRPSLVIVQRQDNPSHEDKFTIVLKKGLVEDADSELTTTQFKTRFETASSKMQYAVKAGKSSSYEESKANTGWGHQQVTLYIVITHFKHKGKWTSEAHVFVSGDRDHDTFFAQRAMQGS